MDDMAFVDECDRLQDPLCAGVAILEWRDSGPGVTCGCVGVGIGSFLGCVENGTGVVLGHASGGSSVIAGMIDQSDRFWGWYGADEPGYCGGGAESNFDFNTKYKYAQVIGNSTIAENREDSAFIWENYYDEETHINEYDLTVFVREEEETFRRFIETHYQRGYTLEEMERLVENAGLTLLQVMDVDTGLAPTPTSERICIVARESGK